MGKADASTLKGAFLATALNPNISHIVCKRSKPPPSTADAACIAIDEGTQRRFLCKDQAKHHWLPLAEWLSQKLARRSGILVPDCHIVELEAKPGEYLFGSEWEGGAEDYSPGIVSKVTNPDEFSRIYAFDMLVHNVDRHMNNYLYLQLAGDTVVKAMDHSRTWWYSGWPLPAPPPSNLTATMANFAHWSAQIPWSSTVASEVVAAWKSIDRSEVIEMIDTAPQDWIDPQERARFVSWWGRTEWLDRADQILGVMP